MSKGVKSIETRHYEERDAFFAGLRHVSRRSFMKLAGLSAGLAMAKGLVTPHGFQLVQVASAAEGDRPSFTFAYVSDTHLYPASLNDRFVRAALKAVDDVNALDPQPDFVLFGGDLAQLGRKEELDLGRQILKTVKAPVHMMVGEHDWFLDLGEYWRELFGPAQYSFEHKGVHFVTLMSVQEKDFWTARGMTPAERMQTVAGLDNGVQSRFEVGEEGRAWLKRDLEKVDHQTPLVVFSHSPLYKYYRPWNFWTEDAEEVQAILKPFRHVTVIHGHTHQLLTNRIDNIQFHGMLSTAWPWPYAPEGLPKLTIQMNRADPFDQFDGCGDGAVEVLESGLVNKLYRGLAKPEVSPEVDSIEKLWIGAIEGFAIGGHCQTVLTLDYVLALRDAYMTLPARKEGIIPGAANLRLARFVGARIARQAVLAERRIDCASREGQMIVDELVDDMDAAIRGTVENLTGSGVVSAAGNRRAFRISEEPLDSFRRYMSVYAREQAHCHFSPALIANLERNWNAASRRA